MKIPLEWLKEYVKTNRSPQEIAESFTALGLLLDKPISTFTADNYESAVLDLEHRMDRSDWLSIIGCARDLAAHDNSGFSEPERHTEKGKIPKNTIKIEIQCPELVNRFNTRVFKGVKVETSPVWLKNRLEAYGIPSINNIVDITNYVMVEYGQPMHAQDLAKMSKPEIVIRRAKNGEVVKTLLGQEVKLSSEQFVLTQDDKPTVIGGIVGGESTGIDETTVDIILDAGNYNQNNVRKSSRSLKIQNETVSRYDKFLHPELTQVAIERATFLILQLAGGEYYENVDWYPTKSSCKKLKLTFDRLKKVGGIDVEQQEIERILKALGYTSLETLPDGYLLEVPFFRTDVDVEDDIIADILRIYGYIHIPVVKLSAAPPKEITPKIYVFEERLRDILVSCGFHEHITDPLVLHKESEANQVVLANMLSSGKNALRTDIRETLDNVKKAYRKQNQHIVKIFELGNIYTYEGDKNSFSSYKEHRRLEIMYEKKDETMQASLTTMKKYLSAILLELGITDYTLEQANAGAVIKIQNDQIGYLYVDGISLFTQGLFNIKNNSKRLLTENSNIVRENLSLLMDKNIHVGPIYSYLQTADNQISNVSVEEEYFGSELGENKKTVLISITYKTSETGPIREKILKKLQNDFNVSHREYAHT